MSDRRSLDLKVEDIDAARRHCRRLASSHYENFTVVLPLLNSKLRQDLANIYAYCRWVDDLADRDLPAEEILSDLDKFETMLVATVDGSPPTHPVFLALQETIERRRLKARPFYDLISAFRQDQQKKEYETFTELVDYSRRSAAPVGRLVLDCFEARSDLTEHYADATSIALQLVNFWADVPIDLDLGRIYLPRADRRRFGVSRQELEAGKVNDSFARLMSFEIERTRDWLRVGWELVDQLDFPLSLAVQLFNAGGWKVLDKIEANGYDVFSRRRTLNRRDKIILLLKGAWASLVG